MRIIVGLPLNMDDTENDMCARARRFARRLEGRFGIPNVPGRAPLQSGSRGASRPRPKQSLRAA